MGSFNGKQVGIRKEPGERKHLLAFILFSLLLPVLPPTSFSNVGPQRTIIDTLD
jgi:hypothetical protein